jgi:hypothetical protein
MSSLGFVLGPSIRFLAYFGIIFFLMVPRCTQILTFGSDSLPDPRFSIGDFSLH